MVKKNTDSIELPDWIDPDAWNGYLEMRELIKKRPTRRALQLSIKTLEKLRAQGNSPNDVLDQSTQRSWQGLFALPEDQRQAGAQTAAGLAWDAVRQAARRDQPAPKDFRTRHAIEQIGGWSLIRDMRVDQVRFIQRDFERAWLAAPEPPRATIHQLRPNTHRAAHG